MSGPAAKMPEERARANVPARGEWQDLPPLEKPVLPALPRRAVDQGRWSPRTLRLWAAWRSDWVTGSYGPAEIAMAIEAAFLFEDMIREPSAALIAEVRQWMDRLGLTMKGKRDLRLRAAAVPTPVVSPARSSSTARLRLVDDAVSG